MKTFIFLLLITAQAHAETWSRKELNTMAQAQVANTPELKGRHYTLNEKQIKVWFNQEHIAFVRAAIHTTYEKKNYTLHYCLTFRNSPTEIGKVIYSWFGCEKPPSEDFMNMFIGTARMNGNES